MAHMQKMKSSAVHAMLNHYERKYQGTLERENIDSSRTIENSIVSDKFNRDFELSAGIKERISEVKESHEKIAGRKIRSDAVLMCDWVVTLPEDCPVQEKEKFFEMSYTFIKERYGEENVLGGFIHVDEKTPHMHIPVVPEKEGKLNAKKIFTKMELRAFHDDLQKYLDRNFPCHVSIKLDDSQKEKKALSKLSHEEIKALNADEKIERIQRLNNEINDLKEEKELILVSPMSEVLEDEEVKKSLAESKIILQALQQENRLELLDEYTNVSDEELLTKKIDDSLVEFKGLKKDKVVLPRSTWEAVKKKHNILVEAYKKLKSVFIPKAKEIFALLEKAQRSPVSVCIRERERLKNDFELEKEEMQREINDLRIENKNYKIFVEDAVKEMDKAEMEDGTTMLNSFSQNANWDIEVLIDYLPEEEAEKYLYDRDIDFDFIR